MLQDDRLAQLPCAPGERQEALGLAELLDHHHDDVGGGILDQELEEILEAVHRLVAARHREGERDVVRIERGPDHGRHGAALRHDADGAAARDGRRFVDGPERERHPVHAIDEAEAVRPFDRHAARASDAREFVLLGAAVGAGLGEAGRKDHDAADVARRAALHGFEHAGARDCEHRAVDAVGQVGG